MTAKFCDANLVYAQLEQRYSRSKIKFVGGVSSISNVSLFKIWRDKRHTDGVRVIRTYVVVDIDLRGYGDCVLMVVRPVKCMSTNLKRAINHITFDKTTPKKNHKEFTSQFLEVNCRDVEELYTVIESMFDCVIKDYLEKSE